MSSYPSNRRVVDRRGKYRWLQFAVLAPAVVSVMLHAAGALWVKAYSWGNRPDRLTDAPIIETVLTLDAPRPRDPPPTIVPPKPVSEPKPEARPAPRPAITPTVVARPAEVRAAVQPAPVVPNPQPESAEPVAEPTPAPPAAVPPEPPALPATFAGVKADVAGRVVYVVDASGAMTTSLTFVLEELARSIERLDESQMFQVVLFREPPPGDTSGASLAGYEMFRPGDGLVPATRANKDTARAWARTIKPLGRSSPLPGLSAALNLNPDLVFLLSRSIQRTGTEPRTVNLALLKTLDEMNPPSPWSGKRSAVIKTIQFIDDDPSGLLPAIAARHGDGAGAYRMLSLEELRGR